MRDSNQVSASKGGKLPPILTHEQDSCADLSVGLVLCPLYSMLKMKKTKTRKTCIQ